MKKTPLLVAILCLGVLTACGEANTEVANVNELDQNEHVHAWAGGTCVAKATCSICGLEGEIEPNNHSIISATFFEAAHCENCEYVEGQAIGEEIEYVKETSFFLPMALAITDSETGEIKEDSIWHFDNEDARIDIVNVYMAPSKEDNCTDIYFEYRDSFDYIFQYDSSKYTYEEIHYNYEVPGFIAFDKYTGQRFPSRNLHEDDSLEADFILKLVDKELDIKMRKSSEIYSEWGRVSSEADNMQANMTEIVSKYIITVPNDYDGLRFCIPTSGVEDFSGEAANKLDVDNLSTLLMDKDGTGHAITEYLFINPYDFAVEVADLAEVITTDDVKPEEEKSEPVKEEVKEPQKAPAPAPAPEPAPAPVVTSNPTTPQEAIAYVESRVGMSWDEIVATYGLDFAGGLLYEGCGWGIDLQTGEIITAAELNARSGVIGRTDGEITGNCDLSDVYIIG